MLWRPARPETTEDLAVAGLTPTKRSTRAPLTDDQLDQVLAAIGDLCDLRCSNFAGHRGATAALVATAAAWLPLPAAEVTLTRRAALVHDVGRFGVPGSVWDKPGPLASRDRERMRLHVCDVERTPGGTE